MIFFDLEIMWPFKKKIVDRIWTKEGCYGLTTEQWFNFDKTKLHRLEGPAIKRKDGTKAWYVNGKLHRLDGPAIEYSDGSKHWYVNGKRHRLDGPAVEESNGTKAWYLDGELRRRDEVEPWLKENKIDLKTPEGQLAFKLRFL